MLWTAWSYATNDIDFIHVLNRFWTTTQTTKDISYIYNICLKPTLLNNVLLYLFYANAKGTIIFLDITLGQTFKFLTQDILINTSPTHFKLFELPNETNGLQLNYYWRKTY